MSKYNDFAPRQERDQICWDSFMDRKNYMKKLNELLESLDPKKERDEFNDIKQFVKLND